MSLHPFRVELDDANDFVAKHHRHHAPIRGHRFSLGVGNTELRGVAICGRPVGFAIDQRTVLEVNRVATDGTRNACSWLYSHAAQMARSMGFRAVITYTLAEGETGASLRACGWWPENLDARDPAWDFDGRRGQLALDVLPPKKGQDLGAKVRWLWLTGCALLALAGCGGPISNPTKAAGDVAAFAHPPAPGQVCYVPADWPSSATWSVFCLDEDTAVFCETPGGHLPPPGGTGRLVGPYSLPCEALVWYAADLDGLACPRSIEGRVFVLPDGRVQCVGEVWVREAP